MKAARGLLLLAAGPLGYALLASAVHLELVRACALFSVVAIAALAVATQARLARDPAALAGLALLGLALVSMRWPALHAAIVLAAAAALGDAFADWVAPRLRDLSVVLTAAVCLALFDVWSVTLGPAHSATAGGFLKRLLLDVPTPGGWLGFLGISDLVLVALLAGLCRRRGAHAWRALLAGLLGVLASLGQAYLTRRPAPALPWIGGFFALLAWPLLRPDRAGWLRTARWGGLTVAALAVVTALRLALA